MSALEEIKARAEKAWEARANYAGESEGEGIMLAYLAEQSSYDVPKLVAALEAVEACLAENSIAASATANRLNQQVIDRHPDADANAAQRYDSYAATWGSAQLKVHDAITEALA